ncbi:SERTA domain-containing protein 3 [Marasmius crinis-equi]|uniref:SERTA domain-containing protein 3 n=1 Tax=Marasmius crinis-equi TaxID=585013 RepID=A0ABR3ER10_9AGAR
MPAQRVFVGQRAKFFEERKAAYAEAVRNDTRKDFLANATREFLNRWPPALPLEVELDQAILDAVEDSVVSTEYPVPVEEDLGAEEYRKKKAEYDEYCKKLEERKGQIARRFKSDWEEENTKLFRDPNDPWNLLLLLLNGALESKKPRLQPAANLWYNDNKEIVKEAVEKKKEAGGKKKNTDAPNMFMSEARAMFAKLDPEVQKEWKSKAATEHKTALEDWNRLLTQPPLTEPEDRQRCINGLVQFVKPILDGIAERTGFIVSLIAGGPEPQDGGCLNCISVHSGTTARDIKMDWARAELAIWKKYIFPSIARFCRKVNSVEECRSRALPMDDEMEDDQEEAETNEMHVVGADLEAVTEQGAVVWAGRRQGVQGEKASKTTDSSAKDGNPISTAPQHDEMESRASKDSMAKSKSLKDNNATSTSQVDVTTSTNAKPAMEDQPDISEKAKGARPRRSRRARAMRSSPARSIPSSELDSRSPSPSACSRPARGRARARMTVLSPIRQDSTETPQRARMTASSPIHLNSPANPMPDPRTPPHAFTPPRHSSRPPSLPPSPLRTPLRSLPPTPGRATPPGSSFPLPESGQTTAMEQASGDMMVVDKAERVAEASEEQGTHSRAGMGRKETKRKGGRKVNDVDPPMSRARGKRRASGERGGGRRGKKARVTKSAEEEGDARVSAPGDANMHSEEPPVVPETAPEYAKCTYALGISDSARVVPGFDALLSSWLSFESKVDYADGPRLKTTGRPKWVGLWFGRHRNPHYLPAHNAKKVLEQFFAWWESLQPEWREFTKEHRPIVEGYESDRKRSSEEWKDIRRSGPNGLSSVIACLGFIAANVPLLPTAVGREKAQKKEVEKGLADAVRDVTFVLDVLRSF